MVVVRKEVPLTLTGRNHACTSEAFSLLEGECACHTQGVFNDFAWGVVRQGVPLIPTSKAK
ncbi:MAG: hypothetical protein LBL06_05310 [Treponema sp.]|nr:hypothetical protein [Treponema sp.]